MDELSKKKQFLQLQFSILLLVCSLLPDFGSAMGSSLGSAIGGAAGSLLSGPGLIVIVVRLVALVFGGMALFAFYKDDKNLAVPFLCTVCGGMAVALLTLIPGTPFWLDYIALAALIAGLCLAKNSLGVSWNTVSSAGAYMILLACLLHCYYGIDPKISTSIAALAGLVMYLMGLGRLRQSLDEAGTGGVSKLKIAVWLGIVGAVVGVIPLLGTIVAGILGIVAFIFEFLGYSALMKSEPLHEEGRDGAGKLRISMIVMVVAAVVGFIPLMGIVAGILTLVALWFIFQGWSKILFGLEQ